jgi:hypothetical protein
MPNRTDPFSAFPFDVRMLWDINGKSLDYAEKAYRAWLDAAGEIQSEAVGFMNSRFAKDSAAIARLGQCQTPAEVLNAQGEYAQQALADFMSGSQKIAACLGNAARKSVFPSLAAEETEAQRPPHRRSGHRASTH